MLPKNCGLPYRLISGKPRKCNGGQTRSSLHFCRQIGPVLFADLLSGLRDFLPFRNILYLFNYRGKEISRGFFVGVGGGGNTRKKHPILFEFIFK